MSVNSRRFEKLKNLFENIKKIGNLYNIHFRNQLYSKYKITKILELWLRKRKNKTLFIDKKMNNSYGVLPTKMDEI